jgi:soluble cytochrome b562
MSVTASKNPSKGQIQYPRKRIAGLRQNITRKNIGRSDRSPQMCDNLGGQSKIVATHGKAGTINGSGRCASDYRKGIAVSLDPLDLTNAFQNTGLIGAASAPTGHH